MASVTEQFTAVSLHFSIASSKNNLVLWCQWVTQKCCLVSRCATVFTGAVCAKIRALWTKSALATRLPLHKKFSRAKLFTSVRYSNSYAFFNSPLMYSRDSSTLSTGEVRTLYTAELWIWDCESTTQMRLTDGLQDTSLYCIWAERREFLIANSLRRFHRLTWNLFWIAAVTGQVALPARLLWSVRSCAWRGAGSS